MKRIRFLKDIEVDYWDARYEEPTTRIYRRGDIVTAEPEWLGRNFTNLTFQDGSKALDVPQESFEVVP